MGNKLTVCIDPGHGAPDPGCVGAKGTKESDIALSVGLKAAEILEKHKVSVVMTRTADKRPGKNVDEALSTRVSVANKAKACLFVSLHANSAGSNKEARGCLALVNSEESFGNELAKNILKRIEQYTDIRNKGVFVDKSYIKYKLYVLENTSMPACLIELGMLSNLSEEMYLASEEVQEILAQCVAKGVLDTLSIPNAINPLEPKIDQRAIPSEWAKASWDWAVSNKLLDGTRPKDNLTREELAVILHRYTNFLEK